MANALIAHNQDRDIRQLGLRAENGSSAIATSNIKASEMNDRYCRLVAMLIENRGSEARGILGLAQRRSIGNPIHDALTGREFRASLITKRGR